MELMIADHTHNASISDNYQLIAKCQFVKIDDFLLIAPEKILLKAGMFEFDCFLLEADYLHFTLSLSDGPFVDTNAALAGGSEEPSICHTQAGDEAILDRIFNDEFFAVIFIENHL